MDEKLNSWKMQVVGVKPLDIDGSGDFDCVDIPKSWAMFLGWDWRKAIGYGDAWEMFANASSEFFEKVPNTGGSHPNISIKPGDIAVYGPTPHQGYTNQYNNPYGHVGVVVGLTGTAGVTLVQQESGTGEAPWIADRPFSYAPLIGILRPRITMEEPVIKEGDIKNFLSAVYQVEPTKDDLDLSGKTWKEAMYTLASRYQGRLQEAVMQGVLTPGDIDNFVSAVFKHSATDADRALAQKGWKEGMYALAAKYQNTVAAIDEHAVSQVPESADAELGRKFREIVQQAK